jgi:transcription initiation factor TFIID TATA-box-binding protein
MIIIGSESEREAEIAAKKIIRKVANNLSIKATLSEFRVTNIVANAEIGWPIDITKIADNKELRCTKDDSFPGVVYKGIESVRAILLFSSGKVVFTGATEKHAIEQAFSELKRKL